MRFVTFQAPIPQNCQTHSNNSSATACVLDQQSVFDHFLGLALKGLMQWQDFEVGFSNVSVIFIYPFQPGVAFHIWFLYEMQHCTEIG